MIKKIKKVRACCEWQLRILFTGRCDRWASSRLLSVFVWQHAWRTAKTQVTSHSCQTDVCVCVCVFLRYGTLCVSNAAQTIWQGHNQIPITHSGLFTSLFVFKTKPHSVCYLLNLTVFYFVLESNSNKNRAIRHCSTPRRYCSTPCPENARN